MSAPNSASGSTRATTRSILQRFLASAAAAAAAATFATTTLAETIDLFLDESSSQARFVAKEISEALAASGYQSAHRPLANAQPENGTKAIVLVDCSKSPPSARAAHRNRPAPAATLRPEGFSVRVSKDHVHVLGHDSAGLLYGGLEVAELIRTSGWRSLNDTDQNAYETMRGVKFNLPLDVRTPSYTDPSDSAQSNIATVWEMDFWKRYIDQLARSRFNSVTLWSLHPFPSMVRVPDFPDIALDDVQRSKHRFETYYSLEATGFDQREILADVETIKTISMDEKIAFWREVMRYGKERNVAFYIVTWNIFVYGTGGKYGITDAIDNRTTIDYFRKSIRQMFITYPDLRGIGLTTGENMHGATLEQKEDWAFRTYGQAVLDVVKEQPGRKITFIHRQHQAGAQNIAAKFAPLVKHPDIEFIFSFKYAQAHALSSTVQPFYRDFVNDLGTLKSIWTLRNDDNYVFRWGAPDFVRSFIKNIPHDVSRGYYYGSDQWIWGRDFLGQEPSTQRELEIDKHWLQWTLWGRLGYDPNFSNDRLVAILQQRFPSVSAESLLAAWQAASMTYPLTTGFHWGSQDFQWYIEACQSFPVIGTAPGGFHDLNRFIAIPPHPGTDNRSIPDYVKAVLAGQPVSGTTPLQVSDQLHEQADKALKLAADMPHGGSAELRRVLEDIRCMAFLGKYYAHKIRAATELALFRATLNREHEAVLLSNLNQAAYQWRLYASTALGAYHSPVWTNRIGVMDWRRTYESVLYEIASAGGESAVPAMAPSAGGVILEAEDAAAATIPVRNVVAGFTGTGYRDFATLPHDSLEWIYEAPADGQYILEMRYALRTDGKGRRLAHVEANDEDAGELILWTSPSPATWVWDRKIVTLKRGSNRLRLSTEATCLIDHLNVVPAGR